MTQEKKLQLAQALYNDPSTTKEEKSLLEKLFPALSIPEDERIRKEIVKYIEIQQRIIKDEGHIQEANDIEKWLVWLEKQGEQKPVDNIEPKFKIGDTIVEKDLDECGRGTIVNIKDGKYIFDSGSYIWIKEQGLWQLVKQKPVDNQFTPEQANILDKHIDKFLEQKPTWSKEDEIYLQDVVEWVTNYIDDEDCGDMTYDEHKAFYMARINWLKSLKERVKGE